MSAAGLGRGHPTSAVFFVVIFVVFVLGSRCVTGRPQNWQDSSRREGQASSPQSGLKFSPELLLEPSLESAASPINVLPYPPYPSPPSTRHTQPNDHTKADDHKVVGGNDARRFSHDLDGPEDKWEQDPDVEDSDVIPPTQRWPERTRDLPQDKVAVSPVVAEDDLNVDRFHGALLGFNEDEDLDVPELQLKAGRNPDPFRTASARSAYIQAPRRVFDQGVPSPELVARDLEVDGPPLPNTHMPMPDDVPADPRQVVPWQKMVEKDVDVDRPIHHHSSPSRPQPTSHVVDTSLWQWKKLALEDLVDTNTDDVSADDREKNPFEDDDEEDSDQVPEELVRQVVMAMDSPPSWTRQLAASTPEKKAEALWDESNDDDDDDDDDQYVDWVVQEHSGPQKGRLITLIFETIDAPKVMLDDGDEEEEDSAAVYEKEVSIWQVLTNFPFPMLLHHGQDTAFQVDYIYDDDDDDDDYDDDEYYDDYSDEEYEDYQDEDEEEDSDDDDDDDGEDEVGDDSDDDLDDYFYSEEYDDCDDCDEDDSKTKEEITILSLAPMLAK